MNHVTSRKAQAHRRKAAVDSSSTLRFSLHIWLVACAVCLVPFFSMGCGRKAPPHAPEDVLPRVITDLLATNAPNGIELSWSRPRMYVDGARMTDLGGFVIERAEGSDPHAAFHRLHVIEVSDRDRFRQIKRFRHLDADTTVGTQYRYRVVSCTTDRYFSDPSNVVTVERATTAEERHAPLPATGR